MFSAAPRSWKQLWCRDEGLVYCYMEFELAKFHISKPCASPLVKQASSVVGNPHRQPCKAGSVSGAARAGPTCFHVRIYPVLLLRITTTFIFTIVSFVMKIIYRLIYPLTFESVAENLTCCPVLPSSVKASSFEFIQLSCHSTAWCDCSQTRTDPKLCNCCRT